jgi:hypothetical protein
LQAPINSLPRSVRPGPVSGEDGQRNAMPEGQIGRGGTIEVGDLVGADDVFAAKGVR